MSELTTHSWHRFEPLARDLFSYGMGLETFTLWRCKITGIGFLGAHRLHPEE